MRTRSLLFALALLPTVALAAPIVVSGTDDSARLSLGDDLYIAGGTITLTENIRGDLTIAGGTVMITGTVGGDLQVAGGNVTVEGTVRESVRAAGGTVIIRGDVGGDVIALGGQVSVLPDSIIAGNVVVASGQMMMDGTINGSIKANGGILRLGGTVRQDAVIKGEEVALWSKINGNATISARKLSIDAGKAYIVGTLKYWNGMGKLTNTEQFVRGAVTEDQALRHPDREPSPGVFAGIIGAFALFSLLSGALVILLLQFITRTLFTDAGKRLLTAPWWSVLYGFLTFVTLPAIVLVLCLTIIGIPLAVIFAFQFILLLLFAKPLTAIVLTRAWQAYGKKKWNEYAVFGISVGIFAALKLLMVIPFLGWLACMLLVCASVGAIVTVKYTRYLKVR